MWDSWVRVVQECQHDNPMIRELEGSSGTNVGSGDACGKTPAYQVRYQVIFHEVGKTDVVAVNRQDTEHDHQSDVRGHDAILGFPFEQRR